MKLEDLTTIDQPVDFLAGTQAVAFSVISDKDACYRWIQGELVKLGYLRLSRLGKGVVIRYLMRICGHSRQQLTRLIAQYRKTGGLQRCQRTVSGLKSKYTEKDTRLLAAMDERHGTPCGPAVKRLCERACEVFGQTEYTSLTSISVSPLYNLRKSTAYSRQRRPFEKTHPKPSKIGERRKPQPNGQPGYIRIDTVHQGDLDKQKGVYPINTVDEVTQFEIVCSVEKISERYLIPALEQLLEAFPFTVLGFHSDNGSEYINKRVADCWKTADRLYQVALTLFERQCPGGKQERRCGEERFGYSHIPQRWAPLINSFNHQHLNPYLNYHRPCFFSETRTDHQGKQRKIYRYENRMTPYDKLKSLPNAKDYLKPGTSLEILGKLAHQISDNQAADQLQKARQKLFKTTNGRTLKTG